MSHHINHLRSWKPWSKYAQTRLILFYQEISDYLTELQTKVGRPTICGDFNLHVENPNDNAAKKFLDLCSSKGFSQNNTYPAIVLLILF